MTGTTGRREKVDAALRRSFTRLLGQVEMEKAKILPAYPALHSSLNQPI